jgi:hypothetical protein
VGGVSLSPQPRQIWSARLAGKPPRRGTSPVLRFVVLVAQIVPEQIRGLERHAGLKCERETPPRQKFAVPLKVLATKARRDASDGASQKHRNLYRRHSYENAVRKGRR